MLHIQLLVAALSNPTHSFCVFGFLKVCFVLPCAVVRACVIGRWKDQHASVSMEHKFGTSFDTVSNILIVSCPKVVVVSNQPSTIPFFPQALMKMTKPLGVTIVQSINRKNVINQMRV